MQNYRTYKSLVATVCNAVEAQCGQRSARDIYDRFWHHPLPAFECTVDFAGELLRQGGIANTAAIVRRERVQGTVVDALTHLCPVLLSFNHPAVGRQTRWLAAYGMGPEGLYTVVALEPGEPSLLPTELWPNVTGAVIVARDPALLGVIV